MKNLNLTKFSGQDQNQLELISLGEKNYMGEGTVI